MQENDNCDYCIKASNSSVFGKFIIANHNDKPFKTGFVKEDIDKVTLTFNADHVEFKLTQYNRTALLETIDYFEMILKRDKELIRLYLATLSELDKEEIILSIDENSKVIAL